MVSKGYQKSYVSKSRNIGIIRKTDVGKYAILSHFSVVKTLEPNSRSKHTPHATNSVPSEADSLRCPSLN